VYFLYKNEENEMNFSSFLSKSKNNLFYFFSQNVLLGLFF